MTDSLTLAHPRVDPDPAAEPAPGDAPTSPAPTPPAPRGRWGRLFLGGDDDPRWARPLLWVLLAATAALYLIGLSRSGYANDFYAAAVKSGTEDWKAWLFGSLDSANAITVDKPPASLWLMVLSARVLGFSSFSMLLPQALLGVGTVGVLYSTVRRWSGPAAGLVAGALLALTPVAALIFRFNNPDALLVFLMTLAAYWVVRAVDATRDGAAPPEIAGSAGAPPVGKSAALRWMILAGAAIGFAFLTKMGQGLLVLPAFGVVYLVLAQVSVLKRIGHLLAAFGAMIVGAGWFVLLVELWPAAARPFIGGSTNNSLWELALGYNGLGRLISGRSGGGGGGGMGSGQNTGFGGAAGITRLFESAFATQISWFLPAALLLLGAGFWVTRRAPRTDRVRGGLLLWGACLVVSGLVFSFMSGTIHPYYSVALAPAIAGLVAVGGTELWGRRQSHVARGLLAGAIVLTAVWSFHVLGRDASMWMPALRWVVLGGGLVGAALLAVSAGRLKKLAVAGVIIGSVAASGGAVGFTAYTAATAHSGSIPMAGPVSSGMGGGGGGGMGGTGGPGGRTDGTRQQPPTGTQGQTGTGTGTQGQTGTGTAPTGGMGGGMGGASTNAELITLLNGTTTRWSAAVIGDQSAAGYILSTDTAVMAIGGWSGSDDAPTLAEFQAYVAAGDVGYFIAGGGQAGGGQAGGGQGGSTSSSSAITAWVEATFTATTVGGTTVYDLTS